jgi:hypothetical protein
VVKAKAAQLVVPRLTVPALESMRPAIIADRWHLVEVDRSPSDYEPAVLHTAIERLYAVTPTWHAAHPDAQAALAARVPTDSRLWPVPGTPDAVRQRRPGARYVVGVQAYSPVEAAAAITALAESSSLPNVELRALLSGTRRSLDASGLPPVQVLAVDGTDIARFVAGLDLLLVPPLEQFDQLPRRAIAEALIMDVPVLATPTLEPELPAGPIFLAAEDWPAFIMAAARRKRPQVRRTSATDSTDPAQHLDLPTRMPAPAVLRQKTRARAVRDRERRRTRSHHTALGDRQTSARPARAGLCDDEPSGLGARADGLSDRAAHDLQRQGRQAVEHLDP